VAQALAQVGESRHQRSLARNQPLLDGANAIVDRSRTTGVR
jgi:hypothetical protein